MKKFIPILHSAVICCFIILFSVLNSRAGDSQGVGVNFRPLTLEQGLAEAKKANKPLYVHGYTDWCHFCMYMKDSVYTDKEVADFMNANFICIKIDMEKEGKELNASLKIHTYPAMLFYDVNGEMMHRAAGRRYKQPFLELGKEALDPRRQMRTFKNKYESGTASPYEVQFYFRMLEIAGMDAQPFINEYLTKLPDSSFMNQNSWRIIYDIIKDPNLPVMRKIIDHKKDFETKYTADSINNKLINLYNSNLMQYVQQLDSVGFEAAKKKIMADSKLDISEKICAWADLNKLKMKSDWEKYKVEAPKFIDKYAMNDFRRLNDVANIFYERFNADKDRLALAEKWAKQSVSIADLYKGNHILASISFMLGKKEDALKYANHAIELGKRDNVDYRQTEQLINVITKQQ